LSYVGDGQVGSLVTGAQILKITYSGSSPVMARSVLGGIVEQLRNYNNGLTAQHDQAAVAYDNEQVRSARAALQTARSNVNAYMAQHPNAGQSDPNLMSLTSAETNASTQLGQANTALSQTTAARDAGGWTIQVVDPPGAAISGALGKKKLLELILAGAFGGLLVSLLAVVALTPAKKEAWEDELPVGTPFVPDAPPADPLPFHMQSSSMPSEAGQERPRLAAGGRIFVRSTPERIEDE
jgi:uncharacterized protein involved in exopolysaccharide biosynthesis